MTPELRKEASELRLHKRGIRLNLQLPVIETEDETSLRQVQQVWPRMQALYQVWQAQQDVVTDTKISPAELATAASNAEQQFLLSLAYDAINDATDSNLSHAGEALYFLLWASNQLPQLTIPGQAAPAWQIEQLMQSLSVLPDPVKQLRLRSKADLLNWSDLLYRLHWAVRHAQINAREIPGRLYAPAIQQWHKAVNWLCCYDEQDDWDLVSTETGGAAIE